LKQGHIGSASPWITIVGVVRDVKNDGLQRLSAGTVYFPTGQSGEQSMWLIVRSDAPLESLAPLLRRELASIDPELPLASLQTLEQAVDATIAQPKFSALMLGIFAAIALALAAIGIYGVISYSVAQRTREIGVRIALGAQRGDVLRMVVGQGMTLAAVGVAIGGVAAAGATRLIAGHLFGVRPADPTVFVSVALTLAAVAFVASAVPAMRATRVDPTDAIRGE
jgi:putative ABC transport system permease protein